MNRFTSSRQEDSRRTENKRESMAVAKDNASEVAYRKEERAHEKLDDIIRNDYVTKLRELDVANEIQHRQDIYDRNHEYGNDLLKQIEENKRRKEKIHQEELAADAKRNEFSQQHRNDLHEFNEKRHQQYDNREQHKHDVAISWRTENNSKVAEQGKLTDLATDNVNFEDDDWGYNTEVNETLRRIQARKVLLEQLQGNIESSYRKFEEDKREHEQILLEIQREEERLRKLKGQDIHKEMEYNDSLQAQIKGNAERKILEKKAEIEEEKNLIDYQKTANEKTDQQKIDMFERPHNRMKEGSYSNSNGDDQSLHSRFY